MRIPASRTEGAAMFGFRFVLEVLPGFIGWLLASMVVSEPGVTAYDEVILDGDGG
jgi:hypothetical protein